MKLLVLALFGLTACSTEVRPPLPLHPIPSAAQLAWHAMEMNAFVHFSINTFTDKEWGYGDESPALFNPSSFDADQWARTFRETGFQGVILTAKHHDGFCLWPSQYNHHNVSASPWREGKGDVVGELAGACKRQGLRFGIYVSPWDRNHAKYGAPAYIAYYRNQLNELFTGYGPLFEMWFDGANGGDGYYGGAREKRSIEGSTYYDWPGTINLVREHAPEIIFFSDAGPGVRWVGNERGIAGETNWNTITPDTLYAGKPRLEKLLNEGSEAGTHWIPAETDVSIRPGWFYHAHEDSLVKTPEQLFGIYLSSVGRGSTLLLNVPPDRRGLIHERDVASLQGFRKLLDSAFSSDLARTAKISAEHYRGESDAYHASRLTDGDPSSYWATDDHVLTSSVELEWPDEQSIRFVSLQEHITLGQRVKQFKVECWIDDAWKVVASGTTIGYKRILEFSRVTTTRLRLTILDSKACPVIHTLSVF